ncbi:MAG: DAK2 domain-containing protein [Clostridia bacterium]|nr:DAK2 domain-containing protein [Clostridiales bacterium]MBQ7917293.1 DAK2 domain-containing protein [Clostridia bacterium]
MLRKMVISGANYLEENKEYVNSLNVFPVPDGDTGTNMSLTMKSSVKELNMCANNDMETVCDAISKGALKGARGNSGVILSQIFKGFVSYFTEMKEIKTIDFANALIEGANVAYKAVTKPKEGTILTVIRAMADSSIKIAKKESEFEPFLKQVIDIGEEALAMTPELLPVLKKAGVVDAGGRGLLIIFNGFLKIVSGDESVLKLQSDSDKVGGEIRMTDSELVDYNSLADIEFAYCTEFFIININKKTTVADIDKLRETLMTLGDSVICIGDLNLIKVHVHTNQPGVALSHALKLGELNGVKIENMLEQFRALKVKSEPETLKKIGIVSVCAGEGLATLFKDLNVDYVIEGGQTMNPSAEDIAAACDKVYAENVFVLPNNKNIILAAELANDLSKRNIFVLPTTSIPQGISAAIAINPEQSIDENKFNVEETIKNVISGSVTYAVKSTSIDGFKLKEGDIMGLGEKKIVAKGNNINDVAEDTIEKLMTDEVSTISLFYGKDVNPVDAGALIDRLKDKYPDLEIDCHDGTQPLYYYLISLE